VSSIRPDISAPSSRATDGGAPDAATPRTHKLVQRISVPFEYPVYFTADAFSTDNAVLADAIARVEPERRHRVYAIVDDGVARAWPHIGDAIAGYAYRHRERMELVAPARVMQGGERAKTSDQAVTALQRTLYESSIDRQSVVVIVGGGALQDMAGYAAATTHRGVRVVRVPTTVASQNDSGVGVKNGINAFGVKNFLGTFSPPFAVINDIEFIATLPVRDRIAGISEAVKVALIRDPGFFEWLDASHRDLAAFERAATETMIRRGAELHLRHIAEAGDPFELGSARPLDFGHWCAHKLESLTDYELRHGEAVAIGLALDSRYMVEIDMLDRNDCERICRLLEKLGFDLWHRALSERDATGRLWVLDGLAEFREHLGGELTLTMLTGIGEPVDLHHVDESRIEAAIQWLSRRHDAR